MVCLAIYNNSTSKTKSRRSPQRLTNEYLIAALVPNFGTKAVFRKGASSICEMAAG